MIIIKRVDNTVKAKKEVCPNGFEKINVLSWKPKETKFYELSPYHLKTDGKGEIDMPAGIIFENAIVLVVVGIFLYSSTRAPAASRH